MEDPDNEKFFQYITELSDYSTDVKIINKDADIISDLITRDYKYNIQLAASCGLKQAYICIYEIAAKYKKMIPIDDFIRPRGNLQQKFEKYNIIPVMERIRQKLHPFKVEVKDDLIETFNLQENSDPLILSPKKLIGILVSWIERTSSI